MLEFVLVLVIESISTITIEGFANKVECELAKNDIVEGYVGIKKMEYTLGKQPTRNIVGVCISKTKIGK